jgi:hypothetical protein
VVSLYLDTGATNMTVTQATAGNLLHDGQADRGPNGVVRLADGSRQITQTIVIHEVTVANRTTNNVRAVVVPDGAEMLLGMSVLSALGVSVDLTSHTLHAKQGGPPPDPNLHLTPDDKAFLACMKTPKATYAHCLTTFSAQSDARPKVAAARNGKASASPLARPDGSTPSNSDHLRGSPPFCYLSAYLWRMSGIASLIKPLTSLT